jgi:hypothetical protein
MHDIPYADISIGQEKGLYLLFKTHYVKTESEPQLVYQRPAQAEILSDLATRESGPVPPR